MIESAAILAEATKIVWTSDDLPNDALAANAPGSIRNWPRGFCRFCGTSRGSAWSSARQSPPARIRDPVRRSGHRPARRPDDHRPAGRIVWRNRSSHDLCGLKDLRLSPTVAVVVGETSQKDRICLCIRATVTGPWIAIAPAAGADNGPGESPGKRDHCHQSTACCVSIH